MLNPQQVEAVLTQLLAKHVAKTGLGRWSIIDNTAVNNKRGINIDPLPFIGKIVHKNEQMMIVKTHCREHIAVAIDYVTLQPKVGTKVLVTPYARRQIDGTRCDRYVAEIQGRDSKSYRVVQEPLYPMDVTRLPIENYHTKSALFRELITNLQKLFAPQGLRNIVHILLDANAKNFKFVDPTVNYGGSYPFVRCDVNSQKFKGWVQIWIYSNGYEYGITIGQGKLVKGSETRIPYELLGEKLEPLIDDGRWRRIQVEILD